VETLKTVVVEDDDGFEHLLARLEPTMRSTLGWFGIPFEDGEDLLQQTFLTFLYKRQEIHNPEAWLLGTLRRRCLMYWRKRRRDKVQHVDAAVLELIAERRRPDQEICDLRSDLNRVLEKLPTRCRSLLQLRYSTGLSPVEAAEALGYRSSGIYKIIDRCLSAFSRQLLAVGFVERE
jgi:RNA polymerase sigma-70 factor (ECF subfamily)